MRNFGTLPDGRQVKIIELQSQKLSVNVLNYGATLQSVKVKSQSGITDVVLGYDTAREYKENSGYLGALIGRVCNRIGGGRFAVDGKEYVLYKNNNNNHLHGGKSGFNDKIFTLKAISKNSVTLSYFSPDGEEGYPGNVNADVTYTLEDDALIIEYFAVSDKKTPLSLTNHAYFNLNGEGSGSIYEHILQIDADRVTPINQERLTDGTFMATEGTGLDFRIPKTLGRDINSAEKQIKAAGGYDINYCLNKKGFGKSGFVKGDKTGITMEFYTDMPGVQLYSGNFLSARGKGGKEYTRRGGFCLETQYYPNGVNFPKEYGFEFTDSKKPFKSKTVYSFR